MNISQDNKEFLRKVFFLALPIILQELVNSAVNIADTVMIGKLGESSITAVALGNQIFFLFILIVFGINSGASVFMGQFWGVRDTKNIHKTMGISFVSSISVALLFLFFAQTIPEKLLIIYTRDPEVLELGVQYLKIVSFTYPFYASSFVINMANRSTERTKFPMMTTISALCINITMNYIFIFIFDLGVKGAAYGTIIARTLEVAIQITIMNAFKLPILGNIKEYFSANVDFVKKFYIKALPVIGNELMWALGVTLYMVAYGLCTASSAPQASIQIANTIKQLFSVIGIGIGSSCAVIIGNMLGAGEIEKAKVYSMKFTKLVTFVGLFMAICLFFISPFIVSTFFDVSEAVRADSILILRVIAISMNFAMLNYLNIIGILRPGGDTLYCLLLDAGSVWFVGVPLAFLCATLFGLPIYFVFLGASMEEVVKLIFSYKRVKSNKWAVNIIE